MTSRIRDLTRTYDWYIYHGNINGKRTLQIESTTSRNGYYVNYKLQIMYNTNIQIQIITNCVIWGKCEVIRGHWPQVTSCLQWMSPRRRDAPPGARAWPMSSPSRIFRGSAGSVSCRTYCCMRAHNAWSVDAVQFPRNTRYLRIPQKPLRVKKGATFLTHFGFQEASVI